MKRVLAVATCVLAFGAVTSVASASTKVHPSCSNCGFISAHGSGTITENSSDGVGYGTVKNGTIAVRGGKSKVGGATKKKWDSNLHAYVYSGKSLCFNASGAFWVRVTGSVSNFGSTARASVTLNGSGDYTLNNGPKKKWSGSSHSLSIRW